MKSGTWRIKAALLPYLRRARAEVNPAQYFGVEEVGEILAAADSSADFYFDSVYQVRTDR
jgi:2-polyprenyl-6-methoxyphenol hydroxylase-like FAD-dependent oxidoreductase